MKKNDDESIEYKRRRCGGQLKHIIIILLERRWEEMRSRRPLPPTEYIMRIPHAGCTHTHTHSRYYTTHNGRFPACSRACVCARTAADSGPRWNAASSGDRYREGLEGVAACRVCVQQARARTGNYLLQSSRFLRRPDPPTARELNTARVVGGRRRRRPSSSSLPPPVDSSKGHRRRRRRIADTDRDGRTGRRRYNNTTACRVPRHRAADAIAETRRGERLHHHHINAAGVHVNGFIILLLRCIIIYYGGTVYAWAPTGNLSGSEGW